MDISHVDTLLRKNTLQTLFEFFIFTFSIIPIFFTYIHAIRHKIIQYQQVHNLYLTLSKRSVTDTLTQVGNRLKLNEELKIVMDQYHRFGQSFGLVMIDIDFFKSVNDQHGHQVGDKILQQFATLLIHHSRSSDIVGRWGGEEFLIIYKNSSLKLSLHFTR